MGHARVMRPKKPRNGDVMRWIKGTALKHQSGDCLDWPYAKLKSGYGFLMVDRKITTANRAVCELAHGKPPTPDHQAAHICGNRSCVNPDHLRWATPAENSADRLAHGTDLRGEKHPKARLTVSDVLRIRRRRGKDSQSKLAKEFGVSREHVRNIQLRRDWVWLKDERAQ